MTKSVDKTGISLCLLTTVNSIAISLFQQFIGSDIAYCEVHKLLSN